MNKKNENCIEFAWLEMGRIRYPLTILKKSKFKRLEKQLKGVLGIPNYIYFDDEEKFSILPVPDKNVVFEIYFLSNKVNHEHCVKTHTGLREN